MPVITRSHSTISLNKTPPPSSPKNRCESLAEIYSEFDLIIKTASMFRNNEEFDRVATARFDAVFGQLFEVVDLNSQLDQTESQILYKISKLLNQKKYAKEFKCFLMNCPESFMRDYANGTSMDTSDEIKYIYLMPHMAGVFRYIMKFMTEENKLAGGYPI